MSMANRAVVLFDLGRLPEARRLHEETLQLQRRLLGPEHPDTLRSLHNLAKVALTQGRLEEARKLSEEALQLRRQVLGTEHIDTMWSMNILANVLQGQGRLKEARKLFEESLDLQTKILGPDHPNTLIAMNNLAWLLATVNDVTLRDPRRAVELAAAVAKQRPKDGPYWNTLGIAQYRAEDWNAAIVSLGKCEELSPGLYVAYNGFFLAMAHWQLGKQEVKNARPAPKDQDRHLAEARKWYDRAVQWMEKNAPQDAELKSFRAEATSLLGMNRKNN
jgi:tetratricopeptide (TPR) repeat protein